MTNQALRVSELDFDTIKQNLKTFYSNQSAFTDYNFEGSALSTIIDLLAYNTHYNAILANMMGNEMFLDSAVSRASAVSIAKQLNYYPTSYSSARAVVDITVNNPTGNPTSIILPKNSIFTSVIDGTLHNFITTDVYEISPVLGIYKFTNVSLYQGTMKTYSYLIDVVNVLGKYTIPDYNIDLAQLKVYVQNSVSDLTRTRFYESKDITAVSSTSNVFYIQGTMNNLYEIYFGDGILGKTLHNGNIVILEYVTTAGTTGNSSKVFKSQNSIAGSSSIAINTVQAAGGGRDLESIDSIKANAPKAYTAQNRMVTASDIKTLLPTLYSNIKSVSVWGGEENSPPDYGTVYVSIEPKLYGTLSVADKNDILTNVIGKKKIISVSYKIVDPQYIFILLSSTVYFDINKSVYDINNMKAIVKNAIVGYNNSDLAKFDGVFRYSKLSALIDAADESIVSNITTFSITQQLVPVYNQSILYSINFYNPIYKNEFGTAENAISTSGFRLLNDSAIYYLEDDGTKYLRRYYIDNAQKIYVDNTAGTVDYVNGRIDAVLNIASFVATDVSDTGIHIYVKTSSFDIVPTRNIILRIQETDITTNAIYDTIASGYSASGAAHTFTSSR